MNSCLLPQFQQGQQLRSHRAATLHGRVNLAVCFFLEGEKKRFPLSEQSMALRGIVQEEGILFLPDHSREERSNSLLWPGSRGGMLPRLCAQ